MHVAVVIPLYKAERFVAATIASVQAQTLTDLECIVVDDGSPDRSGEAATTAFDGDPRFRLVRQANAGSAAARNNGLREVSPMADAVMFLDADDLLLPDALEVLAARLADDAAAVGSYGIAEYVDELGAPVFPGRHGAREEHRRRVDGWRLRSVPPTEPVRFDEAVVVSQLWPPAMILHRRAALDSLGGFDAGVSYTDDWDLITRMTRRGHYSPVGQQVAWYRLHPGQLTRDTAQSVFWQDHVRRSTWASADNSPGQRRAATRAWRNLQMRRTVRCAADAGRALRRRDVREAAVLAAGTALLAVQNLRTSPPPPSAWQVRITRRGGKFILPSTSPDPASGAGHATTS